MNIENIYFKNQNKVVIGQLIKDGYTLNEATNLWINSDTRKFIQDTKKLKHISGARCYDELQMELRNDKYWLRGDFS